MRYHFRLTRRAALITATACAGALLAGCARDVGAPDITAPHAGTQHPTVSRGTTLDAQSTANGVLFINANEGTFSLDLAQGLLTTPDDDLVVVDGDELPAVEAAFRDMANIDAQLAAVEATPPPTCPYPPESPLRHECFVNDMRAPMGVLGTTKSLLPDALPRPWALAAGDRPAAPSYTVVRYAGPDLRTFSGVLPADPALDMPGGTAMSGAGIGCYDLYNEIVRNAAAYRAARDVYTSTLKEVGKKARALVLVAYGAFANTPLGQLPKLSALKNLIPVEGTWAVAGGGVVVASGFSLIQATYAAQAGRMGFLIATFNSYDCANRYDWRQGVVPGTGGGGDGGSPGAPGSGTILIICRYVDHFDGEGHLIGTEKQGCQMQML